MTVQTQKNRIVHEAVQDQTTFDYDFVIYGEENMNVAVNYKDYTGAFTITGVGDPNGGTVTLADAMNEGDIVSLYRLLPLTQEIDYEPYDAFPAETHERGLDKLTLLVQQVTDFAIGSIRFPLAEALGPNTILPPSDERAFKFLYFDADGGVGVSDGTAIGGEGVKSISVGTGSEGFVNIDNSDSENPIFNIRPTNQANRLVSLDSAGKLPEGILPGTEFKELAVIDDSVDMLVVDNETDPERPGIGVRQNVNSPLRLLQLDTAGKIPPGLINFRGLRNLGVFRGDDLCPKGPNDNTCTVPDTRNPSQRWPQLVDSFQPGDYFIIIMDREGTEDSGTMSLFNSAGQANPEIITVERGDGILWLEELQDPDSGDTLISAGWYYVKDMVSASSAEFVAYNPTGDNIIAPTSLNVSLALDDLDEFALDKRTGGTIGGPLTVNQAPTADGHLANKVYVDGQVGNIDADISDLEAEVLANAAKITQIEGNLTNKVGFQDYASETRGGVIKIRISGNDCYITTTDTNP